MKHLRFYIISALIFSSIFVGVGYRYYVSQHNEITRYIEAIRASYWASGRLGRDIYKFDIALQKLDVHEKTEISEDLIFKADFLMVSYEFITTDHKILSEVKMNAMQILSAPIMDFEAYFYDLVDNDKRLDKAKLVYLEQSLIELKFAYDRLTLVELRGKDLQFFLEGLDDEQVKLLSIILLAFLFLLITFFFFFNNYYSLKRTTYLAHYDSLTKLPNRVYSMELLDGLLLKRAKLACFFIDLNGFKAVNDRLGHHAGDLLLKIISQRISSNIKNKDIFARIGGDEFVLVVNEFDDLTNIDTIVLRIIDLIEKPIKIDEDMVQVGAAIGIAFRTKTLNTVDRLLNAADAAMYIAKEDKAKSLSSYHYYNDEVVLKNHIAS